MTNSNDNNTLITSEKSSAKINENHTPQRTYTILIIIIAILIFGGAFATIKIIHNQRQGVELEIKSLKSQVSSLKEEQLKAQNSLENATKAIEESDSKFKNNLNSINKNLQIALQQRLYQSNDWILLKARYYLELAQINSKWSNESDSTLALLHEADVLLTNIHEPRIINIRQEIAKETANLQLIPKLDITGLLSQINAIIANIANLPLKPTISPIAEEKVNITANEGASSWQNRFKSSIGLLKDLVIIRHQKEDILPLPSPTYEAMLREEIRLNLQIASWALLHGDNGVYVNNLKEVLIDINRSFDLNSADTKAVIKQIQKLQHLKIAQQKPIIEQSLKLINQLIEEKDAAVHDIAPATSGVN